MSAETRGILIMFPGVKLASKAEPKIVIETDFTLLQKIEVWRRFSGKVLREVTNHPAGQVAMVFGGAGVDIALGVATGCPVSKIGVGLRTAFGLGCLAVSQITKPSRS
jgi:hypothetical protein